MYPLLKRLLDVVVSACALVALSPLLLALALTVRATSAGPIIYRGRRVGRGGEPFCVFKFRSMVTGQRQLASTAITIRDDPRVTRIGRLLRRSKLDELPQLINVLVGQMSFVGPRPEAPHYVAFYTPEQRALLSVRPGITSPPVSPSVTSRRSSVALTQSASTVRWFFRRS